MSMAWFGAARRDVISVRCCVRGVLCGLRCELAVAIVRWAALRGRRKVGIYRLQLARFAWLALLGAWCLVLITNYFVMAFYSHYSFGDDVGSESHQANGVP